MATFRALVVISACLLGILASPAQVPAGVVFDNPGVRPHPPRHISWSSGGEIEFHHHHFHSTMHDAAPRDANEGHDVAHELSGLRFEPDYDAKAVWVNRTHLVFNGRAGPAHGPAQRFFSHGFIDEFVDDVEEIERNIPAFRFIGDVFNLFDIAGNAFDARNVVRAAFDTWSAIVSDDEHLITGLEFREFDPELDRGGVDIRVSFVDLIAGAVAAWSPADQTLQFARYDDRRRRDEDKIRWYIGDDAAGLPDSTTAYDLMTTALHETGHIVGLDHQRDTDDVLYFFAGRGDVIADGGTFRALSGDDILAARDLYSIPRSIPEPGTLTLLVLGGLGLAGSCCRRLRTQPT